MSMYHCKAVLGAVVVKAEDVIAILKFQSMFKPSTVLSFFDDWQFMRSCLASLEVILP